MLLAGEAGIGKSRLLAETRQRAVDAGFSVLQGYCFEEDVSFPFAPWVDLLRSCFARLQPDAVQDLLGRQASELVKLLPEITLALPGLRPSPPLDSEAEKHRLFEALAQFLTQRTAGTPVPVPLLIIVEDLHWSDETSLDFFHFLVRRLADFPILLLATYRREEVSPRLAHLLAQLDRERRADEIVLGRLERDQVAAMVRAIFQIERPIKIDFLDLLVSLSEGNPFFVEEILKTLVETGDIFLADGRWERKPVHEMSQIPRTVQDTVRQRMEQLNLQTRQILKLAAVIGPRFRFSWLREITGLNEQDLLRHLRDLVDRQLVVEHSDDEFAFRHALTREAVYATIMKRERKELHLKVAETLERLYGGAPAAHLEDLAYHSYQAGSWAKALDYARQAGERAQALFALYEALDDYTRALDAAAQLAIPPPFELLRARAKVSETLGDFERARADLETALAAAAAGRDHRAEWQAKLDLGFLWTARDYAASGKLLLEALAVARKLDDPVILAQTLNRVGNWYANRDEPFEARPCHEEASRIYQARNDPKGLAETLELLAVADYVGGDALQGVALCHRAIPLFQQVGDRRGLVQTLLHLMTPGQFDTEVGEASDIGLLAAHGDTALGLAREMGWRAGEGIVLMSLGECLVPAGQYARALDVLQAGLAIGEELGHRLVIAGCHWLTGQLYLDLLHLDVAREHSEQARAAAEASNSVLFLRLTTANLALACIAQNDLDRAEAVLDTVLAEQPRTRHLRICWYAQAELALRQGRPARCLEIVDDLIASAANIDRYGPRGIPRIACLRGEALAALGRPEEARAALLHALEGAAAQGRRPLCWRIHAGLGHVYRALAQPGEAEREFAASRASMLELAAALPEDALRERFVQRALASIPAMPAVSSRQAARQAYGGLTAREREVAALIGRGKTNAEIAGELVTSKRTIEKHVGAILSKLEFTSRAQIVAWAIEKGLTRANE